MIAVPNVPTNINVARGISSTYPKIPRYHRSKVVALAFFDFENDRVGCEALHQEEVVHWSTWKLDNDVVGH